MERGVQPQRRSQDASQQVQVLPRGWRRPGRGRRRPARWASGKKPQLRARPGGAVRLPRLVRGEDDASRACASSRVEHVHRTSTAPVACQLDARRLVVGSRPGPGPAAARRRPGRSRCPGSPAQPRNGWPASAPPSRSASSGSTPDSAGCSASDRRRAERGRREIVACGDPSEGSHRARCKSGERDDRGSPSRPSLVCWSRLPCARSTGPSSRASLVPREPPRRSSGSDERDRVGGEPHLQEEVHDDEHGDRWARTAPRSAIARRRS